MDLAEINRNNFTRIILSVFEAMGINTVGKARSEHCGPRVEGSIPVRNNFLLNLFCSNTILADLTE